SGSGILDPGADTSLLVVTHFGIRRSALAVAGVGIVQAHFMGSRPDGWLEKLAAEKARLRRKVRTRWILAGLGVLVVVGVVWGAFSWG
ncbi:MAG: hypothetical protein M3531_01415, partial [Pseudomonadota bacterium]|nr:hypothetical protein [Pseudomonadota bacterium]